MKKLILALLLATSLHAETLPMVANQWVIWTNAAFYINDGDVPLKQERNAISFQFPIQAVPNNLRVGYVRYPYTGTISGALVMTFQIDTKKNPVWNGHFSDDPDNNGPGCTAPAGFHLYIEKSHYDPNVNFDRWFSNPISFTLTGGTQAQITVPLTGDQWQSVGGGNNQPLKGDATPEAAQGFQDALNDVGAVGFTFSAGCFLAHGVNISGPNGVSAKFTLKAFEVQR